MGRKGRSKKDAAEDRDPGMCKADLLLAYQLMDTTNPFPSASVAARQPLAWKVCCALAQAASLHPGCMFVHMLCLVALTLNAVQVKYSGLLGKFCNLMVLQHGPPGDGKSIALWLDLHILSYFDKLRLWVENGPDSQVTHGHVTHVLYETVLVIMGRTTMKAWA